MRRNVFFFFFFGYLISIYSIYYGIDSRLITILVLIWSIFANIQRNINNILSRARLVSRFDFELKPIIEPASQVMNYLTDLLVQFNLSVEFQTKTSINRLICSI